MTRKGSLFIVGLGPGGGETLTPQAHEALRRAEVIVGYDGYFPWIADLVAGKECLAFPMTQEVERAKAAVQRSREQAVCIISSGDAGIYGMASPILEALEEAGENELPEVVVVPGISAVNASAALLGAPLGHDFAVISLSDLLTPWEMIEKRLQAAAEADFVTAILNPRSRKRHWQLGRAQEIFLQQRSPQTPVGIVRNACRPDQAVAVITLAQLADAPVDMFTTVIVGNSQTRSFRSFMLTPRGYR